jgi:dTDP-4-amino-4,6-dideoxygalactose transaminase
MHQQPVFKGAECHLTGAADRIFADGLCLPSGADMTDADIDLVSQIVVATLR